MHTDLYATKEAVDLLVKGGDVYLEDGTNLQMVLQVLTNAGQVLDDRNFQILQQLAGTDPGQLQDLRRAYGPGRKDNLAARFQFICLGAPFDRDGNACGTPFVDLYLLLNVY